jgi:hypothetical protein
MERRKKGGTLKIILITVVAILIISALFDNDEDNSNGTNDTEQTTGVSESDTTEATTQGQTETTVKETEEVTTLEPFQDELSSGHYTSGIDFPPGKYNLTAVKGSGNVSTSNMFTGGLNEIMGNPADDYSIEEFKNANLEDGVVLSISGNLKLNISTEEAETTKMSKRENPLTETVELSSGNYVAGEDFPAGIYNIVATSGSGNVSSSNMFEGGLNEIMGSSADDFSIKEFKNASLDEGVELTISGVSIELVPSS